MFCKQFFKSFAVFGIVSMWTALDRSLHLCCNLRYPTRLKLVMKIVSKQKKNSFLSVDWEQEKEILTENHSYLTNVFFPSRKQRFYVYLEFIKYFKNSTAGHELDSVTAAAVCSPMAYKLMNYFTNESLSCIELIFSANTSVVKLCGSKPSIYEKCHQNISYGTLCVDLLFRLPCFRDICDHKLKVFNVSTFNQSVFSQSKWKLKM